MKTIFKIFALPILLFSVSANAQCTTGATQLLGDGKFYGCVEGQWKKITEDVPSNAAVTAPIGVSQNINGIVHMREANNVVSQFPNIGNVDESISDAPPHVIGKVYYSNSRKHFYQGVAGGLWHQIDNMVWTANASATASGKFTRNNCPRCNTTQPVTYTTSASVTKTSTISQQDADQQANAAAPQAAQDAVNSGGQDYANTYGICTPVNTLRRDFNIRNNSTGTFYLTGVLTNGIINPDYASLYSNPFFNNGGTKILYQSGLVTDPNTTVRPYPVYDSSAMDLYINASSANSDGVMYIRIDEFNQRQYECTITTCIELNLR